jgi:hypothetical protein
MCLLGPGEWWKYDGNTIITAKLVVVWKRVLHDKSAGNGRASGTGKDCRLRIEWLVSLGIKVYWGCMSVGLVARCSSLLYAQFARGLEVGNHDDELVAVTIRRRGEMPHWCIFVYVLLRYLGLAGSRIAGGGQGNRSTSTRLKEIKQVFTAEARKALRAFR